MYCRYHSTVSHKLKSARFFLGKINDLASPDFLEENEPFEYQSYRHEVNRNLDCFLFSVGASLDVLAREVLGYFDLIGNEPNIYYGYAKKKLTQTNKGSWLITKLEEPSWCEPFKYFRNTITHEEMITEELQITYFPVNGSGHGRRISLLLPPNPEGRIPHRNRNVDSYCNYIFTNLLKHISPIYGAITKQIKTSQTMPLR